MSWSELLPSIVALFGIPLAAALALFRESLLRRQQEEREDAIRADQQRREDEIRTQQFGDWVSQRWWERKAEVYTAIMVSLCHLLEYTRQSSLYYAAVYASNKEDSTNDYRAFSQHRTALQTIADAGSFVISESVAQVLRTFFQETDLPDYTELDETADTHVRSTQKCLDAVRAAALTDLGIDRR